MLEVVSDLPMACRRRFSWQVVRHQVSDFIGRSGEIFELQTRSPPASFVNAHLREFPQYQGVAVLEPRVDLAFSPRPTVATRRTPSVMLQGGETSRRARSRRAFLT